MRMTVIVQGRLAFAAHRAAAARGGENGLQIMTVTQLAARLAGGFLHQVAGEELEFAVARALDAGGFEDIESVRHLPGMTRAVARTLRATWNADFRLADALQDQARMRDLALLEDRVRHFLPGGARLPAALRDEARANAMGFCAVGPGLHRRGPFHRAGLASADPRTLRHGAGCLDRTTGRRHGLVSGRCENVYWRDGDARAGHVRRLPPRGARSLPVRARLDCVGTSPAQGHRDLWRDHRRVG